MYLGNVASKQQIAALTEPSGNITGVSYSPDGKTLAAGTDTGYVYLWDAETLGSE